MKATAANVICNLNKYSENKNKCIQAEHQLSGILCSRSCQINCRINKGVYIKTCITRPNMSKILKNVPNEMK